MKRKKYFHFAVGRVIASLLIGAVIFSVAALHLSNLYQSSIDSGFDERVTLYKKMINNYDQGKYGTVFISAFTNFYTADYLKFAKISDDGSIETVYETDYNVIPVEDHIEHWYYVTNDPELLAEGKRVERLETSGKDWTIEYVKCDEAWKIS